jgi:8-oxo-dGTP pyrophosphatase MutT (NUDIX family)
MQLNRWQLIRTRAFMFSIAVTRRITLGARAVLIDGDRILLLRHTYIPGWQFPGGGVEAGESAETCVVREVEEETGYRITGRPALHGFFHNTGPATDRDHVALYVVREFEKAAEFSPNFEIAQADWFDRRSLPADIDPGTAARLGEIFDGQPVSPTW